MEGYRYRAVCGIGRRRGSRRRDSTRRRKRRRRKTMKISDNITCIVSGSNMRYINLLSVQ
jgi:hypothetical protein